MDDFKLGLFKAAIGTHTTTRTKREFMLSLYDARQCYTHNISDTKWIANMIVLDQLLLDATKEYSSVAMPDYYKAVVWHLH